MPPLDKEITQFNPDPIRILAYGKPKTKKTWWALAAAQSNFNVIVLDSDAGMHIKKQIPKEFWHRISHVNIVKTAKNETVPAEFMTYFLRGNPFMWDEQAKTKIVMRSQINPEHSYYYINTSKLTKFDVVVPDSWTKITEALHARWYVENRIEFTDPHRADETVQRTHRGLFGWTGGMATWMCGQLKTLNSHVILIAHHTLYEKRKLISSGGAQREVVEWSKIIPVSTSGPNAMKMGVDFEILYFTSVLKSFKIDASADADREGGSRIVDPKSYNWDDLPFGKVCTMANVEMPNADTPAQSALTWFAPGEEIPDYCFGNTASTSGILPAQKPAQAASFASLLGKKGNQQGDHVDERNTASSSGPTSESKGTATN